MSPIRARRSAVHNSLPRSDFWEYFEPIREHMPANCSADVQAVIEEVDSILDTGNPQDIEDIKANFGLEAIVHLDDFASARTFATLSRLICECPQAWFPLISRESARQLAGGRYYAQVQRVLRLL